MPCIKMDSPGMVGFICTRSRREIKPCSCCGKPSTCLCDYPLGRGRTCDMPLCNECRAHVGMDTDLCPLHDTPQAIELIFHGGCRGND